METIGLLGILGICSMRDVRHKTIQTGVLLLSAIIGLWLHLVFGSISVWDMLGGMAIGGVLFVVAHFSDEKIGKGDAFLVMICGIFLGFLGTLLILWMALLFANMVGITIAFFKRKRRYEMPFVPFLLVS